MWFDCVNMIAGQIIFKCILFGCFISCNSVVITSMVSNTIGANTSLTYQKALSKRHQSQRGRGSPSGSDSVPASGSGSASPSSSDCPSCHWCYACPSCSACYSRLCLCLFLLILRALVSVSLATAAEVLEVAVDVEVLGAATVTFQASKWASEGNMYLVHGQPLCQMTSEALEEADMAVKGFCS